MSCDPASSKSEGKILTTILLCMRQVWNPEGTLVGKFFVGAGSCNVAFAGDGKLVILAERAIYLARVVACGVDLSYP